MAKGDPKRTQNQIDFQGSQAQSQLNNLRQDTLIPQNQQFWNNFQNAQQGDEKDLATVKNSFTDFRQTGGFSPTDISSMRARSVAPVRSLYAGANRDVDRQRALQGGYSPGFGVMKARLAREGSSALSDATTNAEGMIADKVQGGKQFGASGLLGAYGQAPGLSSMAGNQVLASTGQRLQGEQQQQGLGMQQILNQIAKGNMKGGVDWKTIASMAGTAAMFASDRNLKKNIKPYEKDIIARYKKLPIYDWMYKKENTKHTGPMAQDFKKVFGVGDGKTISVIDVMGTTMALNKAIAEKM